MIKELINFTQNLDEGLKNIAYKPSKGLHILVSINENELLFIEKYLYYNGTDDLDENLSEVLLYERFSSYISMNQQQKFDKKQKIHSASPFSFAFNFSLGSSKSDIENAIVKIIEGDENVSFYDKSLGSDRRTALDEIFDQKVKAYKIEEVKKSIQNYFINAKKLCIDETNIEFESQISRFEQFCQQDLWDQLPTLTMQKNASKKKEIEEMIEVSILGELKEKDYVRVYLTTISNDSWQEAYKKYYQGEYPLDEFNDNDFISTFPDKKPFMSHQTATFQTFKVNGVEANVLKQFKDVLSAKPKIIPNPFPLFIYQDELQKELISLFNKNRTLSYTEMIQALWDNHSNDFSNYYLINWYLGKDIVFQDFDFVSHFKYEFDAQIENLFEIQEKGGKSLVHYPKISNVFELEQSVFKSLLQSKYLKLDYFGDLKKDDYESRNNTFHCFAKYRKAVYDFIYKSKRQSISENIFSDMVFSHIKDDLKQNNGYSIKEKLNIWYSLYEKFNNNNKNNDLTMASQLKKYQAFVAQLSMGKIDADNATDAEFAFAAGQVIDYILGKSQAQDKSYQLLEPYLQQAKCQEFKRAIANDVARYKHAINDNETRFKSVCDFVLTYETTVNMKELMPEILAGVFSKCQFFQKDENKAQEKI
jgi:CRISPR-associated protein Csh1